MRRLAVDATSPALESIEEAGLVIRAAGVVALPTDTLYGLAVDPFRLEAVARIFRIKRRGAERALPLIAATTEQIASRIGPLAPIAERLANRFWPGPLT